MHTHPDTHIYPDVSAHWYTQLAAQINHSTHVHRLCQLNVHMFAHRSTCLNVCTCPCTHICIQTYPVYTCVHTVPDMLAYPDPSVHHCTPCIYRHKTAHVHTHGIHNHVHTSAYRTTVKDLNVLLRSVHSHTGSSLSVLSNHEFIDRPLVSSTIQWAQAPLPQPHDRQLMLLPTPMPALASHPPGVPRSLINPSLIGHQPLDFAAGLLQAFSGAGSERLQIGQAGWVWGIECKVGWGCCEPCA